MNSAVNDPANKVISVKNGHNDPKTNAMTRRMEQSYPRNVSAAGKQTLAIASTINNQEQQLYEDCLDIFSIKGRFGSEFIGNYPVPFIIRIINGEELKFVSVRMAETHVLRKLLDCLNAEIYTCTSIRSYFITDYEAMLLNHINKQHYNFAYGKEIFSKGTDYIVRLEDVHQFHTFMEVCYNTFACNNNIGRKAKFGIMHHNHSKFSVPYCIKDKQKYFPLFYFEYKNENKIHPAVKLENWDLAYLKLCFKVQGIKNEFIAIDSCIVISLDDIKNYCSEDLNLVDFWPNNMDNTRFLQGKQKNPSGAWIKTPPKNSQMPQLSSFGYNVVHVVPPPPLARAGNDTSVIGNTVSSSNVVPSNQCITTMNNSFANIKYAITYSNRKRQLNSQHATNNSQAQPQLRHEQQQQQQQHQQQRITTPQTQLSSSSQSVHYCVTNCKMYNARRNIK